VGNAWTGYDGAYFVTGPSHQAASRFFKSALIATGSPRCPLVAAGILVLHPHLKKP